jgi:hypothetical protein
MEYVQQKQANRNGSSEPMFSEEVREEVLTQFALALTETDGGPENNAFMLQALAGNWSMAHFLDVARRRGRSFRHLLALADKSQEIQGWAMLDFMAEAVGHDLNEQLVRKAVAAVKRLRGVLAEYVLQYGDDPDVEQIISEALEDTVVRPRIGRQRYWYRVARTMGGDAHNGY